MERLSSSEKESHLSGGCANKCDTDTTVHHEPRQTATTLRVESKIASRIVGFYTERRETVRGEREGDAREIHLGEKL